MKKLFVFSFATALAFTSFAQKAATREGKISFQGKERDIRAENTKVSSAVNTATGDIQFSLLMNNFLFEKELMQEHFREKYLETEKFDKSTFKGKVQNYNASILQKDGVHDVTVEGDLTLHGETKHVTTPGKITVKGGKLTSSYAKFTVKLVDYAIKVPAAAAGAVGTTADIIVDAQYDIQQ